MTQNQLTELLETEERGAEALLEGAGSAGSVVRPQLEAFPPWSMSCPTSMSRSWRARLERIGPRVGQPRVASREVEGRKKEEEKEKPAE